MFLRLTTQLFRPPRSTRNSYFPWHNIVLQRTGKWIEPNRVILNVPVTLTKQEIRQYLTQIYGVKVIHVQTLVRLPRIQRVLNGKRAGQYYRDGVICKRAYVVTEDLVPNEAKMIMSSRALLQNPDILGRFKRRKKRGRTSRHLPVKRGAWKHPLPKLLSPETMELNPKVNAATNPNALMLPNLRKPTHHGLMTLSPSSSVPAGIHPGPFKPVDLRPWRERCRTLQEANVLVPPGASSGISGAVPAYPLAEQVALEKPGTRSRDVIRIGQSHIKRALRKGSFKSATWKKPPTV